MSEQDFSDDGLDMDDGNTLSPAPSNNDPLNDSKRHARAQHNALERRRRDNIKDMYCSLKDEIPNFSNDRQASRAQILKKAYESIKTGNSEANELEQEIEKIEELNRELRKQVGAQTVPCASAAANVVQIQKK